MPHLAPSTIAHRRPDRRPATFPPITAEDAAFPALPRCFRQVSLSRGLCSRDRQPSPVRSPPACVHNHYREDNSRWEATTLALARPLYAEL
jgi:hypothetical protein